jgi:hypothetical protein
VQLRRRLRRRRVRGGEEMDARVPCELGPPRGHWRLGLRLHGRELLSGGRRHPRIRVGIATGGRGRQHRDGERRQQTNLSEHEGQRLTHQEAKRGRASEGQQQAQARFSTSTSPMK